MSSKSQSLLNWLLQQFQLQPGKPDIAASLQSFVLVLVPIRVGVLMHHPAASAIALKPKSHLGQGGFYMRVLGLEF
jgi:hypothetical protein